MTNVVVVPNRGSAGQLAKQLMTLDRAADGRFVAGVGIGDRADDYEVAAQEMAGRHDRFDTMIEDVQRVLTAATPALEKVGPRQGHGRPPLLVGGRSEATFERAARYGIGWTVSISHPDQVRDGVAHLRKAWGRAGRYGEPRVVALTYFGLGEEAPQKTPAYLRSYYEFIGPIADLVATSAPTNGAGIRGAIAAYADAGADELIFLPTLPGTGELELLADAAAFSLPRAASR